MEHLTPGSMMLSDRAADERVAVLVEDGRLPTQIDRMWRRCGAELIAATVADWWQGVRLIDVVPDEGLATRFADFLHDRYSRPIDRDWVRREASLGADAIARRIPTPLLSRYLSSQSLAVQRWAGERFADDPGFAATISEMIQTITGAQLEIMFAELTKRNKVAAAAARSGEGQAFRSMVGGILSEAMSRAQQLGRQTGHT